MRAEKDLPIPLVKNGKLHSISMGGSSCGTLGGRVTRSRGVVQFRNIPTHPNSIFSFTPRGRQTLTNGYDRRCHRVTAPWGAIWASSSSRRRISRTYRCELVCPQRRFNARCGHTASRHTLLLASFTVPRDKTSLTETVPGTAIFSASESPSRASSPPIG